ncbi:DUF3307 domain-containing protein [Ruegeria pomeroyi]|uniref:DUF3307 domain-containing protein n=1 Tax=Ruegeria alba TaxID=2916756 RepID=A0ABS9NSZ5_9RHOB|nr:DUF3307 domain-containing protein [Ruegeria alba]MCE8511963.1 DUF3307 domain-containing protein [Ruegeria pomeroyi]MCE8520531.1 DUF3307 domain-containing protein [Ruegeria pomeroyi]MCE8524918.1 DUF3307 domain-containing protein [Ruegeria pomeroyi]MCE8528545.1 DUF3307 domain-containing protein [Ruegeria pomeroyi]MCE8533035.1 DUF3307 domain-containing protein [Ruegeria pomeroyi]
MPVTIASLLLVLGLLQVKHMFADFFLQTPRMLSGRCQYWHLGRAQHAGIHALGSVLLFLVVGAPAVFALVIAVLEWVVHFNIDYGKASYSDRNALQPNQAKYWYAMGFDQFLHQLTYLAMAWAWVEFAH